MNEECEINEFLKVSADTLHIGKNEEERSWLITLFDKLCITRGRISSDRYQYFLYGLKRVVQSGHLDYSLVSVRELVDSHEDVIVDHSVTGPLGSNKGLHRHILCGKFNFSFATQDDEISFIHLQDKTGSVQCKVTESLRRKLIHSQDSWCFLSSWRLISKRLGTIYIEVTKFFQEEDVHKKREIQVLSTADVALLLENKDKVKPGCVNVLGKAICVSEIMKIKENFLLCIELEDRVAIIVKDRKYLYWHDLLTPQTEFVFLGLLPTTMYKGTPQEKRVLVPWKNSEVLIPTMEKIELVPLSRWLNVDQSALVDPREQTAVSSRQELCTYQGEITNTDLENFGVYQLDKTVWLVLSCVPYIHYPRELNLGSHITVYNSHMAASKQVPKICFISCTSGCVNVTRFSDLPTQTKNTKLSAFVRQKLLRYAVNKDMAVQFARFLISLYTKFNNSLCSQFDWMLDRFVNGGMELPKRNYTGEFLSSPHSCFLDKTKPGPKPGDIFLPGAILCSDITFATEVIYRQGYNLVQSLKNMDRLNTELYWIYYTDRNTQDVSKVLIGYIKFSSDNGKILLIDDTGCLKCLLQKGKDKNELELASLNGCLVTIQNYTVVYEKFQICQYPNLDSYGQDKYVSDFREEMYLTISVSDVEVLMSRKKTLMSSECDRVLCCVIRKESLLLEGMTTGQPRLRFTAVGYFLDDSWTDEEIHNFLQDAFKFQNKNIETEMDTACAGQHRIPLTSSVVLLFQGQSVQWYEAVQPGHVYWFVSDEKLNPISTKSTLRFMKKVEKQAGGKACVPVPEDVWVTERRLKYRCQHQACYVCMESHPVTDIGDIIKEGFAARIVSFEGRIKSRRHLVADNKQFHMKTSTACCSNLCVSTLDNQKMSVVVSSLDSGEEVVVYLTLTNISYPLGLLPGHVIRFHNLERKVSRHGSVYCQYLVISTVQILDTVTQHLDSEVNIKETKDMESLWENVSVHRLCEVQRSSSLIKLQNICHIHRITKLAFKSSCINCSSVIYNGECGNTLCDPGHGTKFSASASFSIDDGTSFANVKCYSRAVQKLLQLTDTEWSSLEEAVKNQGDIFLTSNSNCESSVELFLHVLREGDHLHQPKRLLLQVDKHQQSREPAVNIDNIPTSDFAVKTVDTGCGKVETRCLPFLQLICLDIRAFDIMSYVMHNFTESSK